MEQSFIASLISNVMANYPQYLEIALTTVGVFAMIATLTPNKTDDKVAQIILDAINFLAGNFGKSMNHPKVGVNKPAPKDD